MRADFRAFFHHHDGEIRIELFDAEDPRCV
jgi:hypothetical protein